MTNNIANIYNSLSDTYEEKYVVGGWDANHYMFDEKIANKRFTESKLTGKIISLGCGSGQDIPICNNPDPINFVGYDVSAGMLRNARKKFPDYTFIEHDCNAMIDTYGDILVSMFGAGNYLGLTKLLEHYNHIRATKAFFILYKEHYVDGIVDAYHIYTKEQIEKELVTFNPVVDDLWPNSNYYVVYWDEV